MSHFMLISTEQQTHVSNRSYGFGEMESRSGTVDLEDITNQNLPDADDNESKNIDISMQRKSVDPILESNDPLHGLHFPVITVPEPPRTLPRKVVKQMWCSSPCYVSLRSRFLVSEYPPFQCGTVVGFMGLYHERMCQLTSYPYMIHPYSDFITWWNFLLGIILAINFVYSPFLIAFDFEEYITQPYVIVNFVICALLLCDVFLNFVTGMKDEYSGAIIFQPRKVAWNYLTGWFLFDLITRAPLDGLMIFYMSEEERQNKVNLEYARLVALIMRTLRYRKMYEILVRISDVSAMRSLVIPWILKLAILILYCIHWLACFHWLLPDMVNAHYAIPKKKSWITEANLWKKSLFLKYINVYLRSLSNLMGLDGGENIPNEPEEIIATIVGIIMSLTIFAYFISSFTRIMSQIHATEEKYERTFRLIQDYLLFRKIPPVLQEKVLTYFQKKYRGHMFSDAIILQSLSPILRAEVAAHNCRAILEKVPLFQKLPPAILVSLAEKLQYEVYVPGDVIMTAESRGEAMYFVLNGELEVLGVFGNHLRTMRDGEYFGEMAILSGDKLRETVVATVPSEVYKLSKKDFRYLVESSPEVFARLAELAKEKIDKERKIAEEEQRRAQATKNWKKAKKQIADFLHQTQKEKDVVIDTFGLNLIGDVEEDEEEAENEVLNPNQTPFQHEELWGQSIPPVHERRPPTRKIKLKENNDSSSGTSSSGSGSSESEPENESGKGKGLSRRKR